MKLVTAIVILSLSCASAPTESFYTLNAGLRGRVNGATRPDGADGAARPRGVVVAPPALPELIDRPQLVLQTGVNQIQWLEQERWAEPLRAQIARVVAEDLERVLGGGWRIATREEVLVAPDCRVSLDVRRFDSSRAGPVADDVLWRVACAGGAVRTGRSAAEEPVVGPAVGDGLAAVVAAHGRALDRLGRDVARALREAAP